jgi:hypothetical protein
MAVGYAFEFFNSFYNTNKIGHFETANVFCLYTAHKAETSNKM